MENPLWRPLMGKSRKKKKIHDKVLAIDSIIICQRLLLEIVLIGQHPSIIATSR